MNWDNKDKDPWGNKNDAPDFDELMKKFSSILGRKKTNSSGSGKSGKGGVLSIHQKEFLCTHFLVFQ